MNKLTFTGLSILLIGIIMQRLIILYFSLPDSLSLPVQLVINLSEYYFLNTCAIITLHSLVRTIGFTPILRLPKSIKILLLVFLFEFYSIEIVASERFELTTNTVKVCHATITSRGNTRSHLVNYNCVYQIAPLPTSNVDRRDSNS